jgi:MYXO-CTERM domain-containing protein
MRSVAVALVAAVGVLLFTVDAQAQPSSKEEITTLEKQLASEATALSTSDCSSACRALASIRRAADKICALDSGDRCTAARAKADDATKRVRAACPDCAIASAPGGTPPPPPAPIPEPKPADAPAKGGAGKKGGDVVEPTANAPPAESKRGGCAGCATTKATHGDLAGVALVAAALFRMLRRRRQDERG